MDLSKLPTTKEVVNLAIPTAYRILVGYDHNTLRQYTQRGCSMHSEYATALVVWESDFIERYFKTFVFQRTITSIATWRRLGMTAFIISVISFSIAYTDVSRRGVIRLLKGGVANV